MPRKDTEDSVCGGGDISAEQQGEVDQKTIEEYIRNQGRGEPDEHFTIVPCQLLQDGLSGLQSLA